MARPQIHVVSHLKASEPPDAAKLHLVLSEILQAIYAEETTLDLEEGSVGDNEFENMVHLHSSLNAATRHHVEGILDRLFGPHFIVGYNGEMEGNFTDALDEAERIINERLQSGIPAP